MNQRSSGEAQGRPRGADRSAVRCGKELDCMVSLLINIRWNQEGRYTTSIPSFRIPVSPEETDAAN